MQVSCQGISQEIFKTPTSPSKAPNNKHIIPADTICVNKQLGTGEFGIVQQGVWTNGNERVSYWIKYSVLYVSVVLILFAL